MIAASALSLGAAIIGFVSAIGGASVCAYHSSGTSRTNLALLNDKLHQLESLFDTVMQLYNSTAVLNNNPRQWIEETEQLLSIINGFELESRLNQTCMNGWLPSVCVQFKARRLIEEMIGKLDRLLKVGSRIPREKVRGHKQPTVDIVGRSREEVRSNIWQHVSKSRVGTICIHGIAGVGKTVIAAEIHNQALQESLLFDHVIWVSIKHASTLWQIQEAISSTLYIDISESKYTVDRAKRLSDALMQRQKFLLVLDSMWQAFSLQDIGIPDPKDGCKLIVTSRVRSVCKSIKPRELVEIKPLTMIEAWELFEKEAGSQLNHLSTETLARTKNAGYHLLDGLPAAIKMLALKLSDMYEGGSARVDAEWMEEVIALDGTAVFLNSWIRELFECFKDSYFNLPPEMRPFLLFCAVYPKGCMIKTKELIGYWMSQGLLGAVESLHYSRKRGSDVLKELINAHLLESVTDEGQEESVKMLNLVRLMTMDIMLKEKHQVFIKSGNLLTEFPPAEDWPHEVEIASFMNNQLTTYSVNGEFEFQNLSMLFLQDNLLSSQFSGRFFDYMPNLKVLDVSRTACSSLPKCLSNLYHLRALLLRDCPNLTRIPTLQYLQQLVVLDLSGTPLDMWPAGIQYLERLKYLNLSHNRFQSIPTRVISKLMHLEELLLITDYEAESRYLWGSNLIGSRSTRGACIEDLMELQRVAVLELNFQDALVFNTYVRTGDQIARAPPSFKFRVGRISPGGNFGKNSIAVCGDYQVDLPEKTLELHLMMNSEEMFPLRLTGCLRDLKIIDISNFNGLRYLFTVEIIGLLQNLEKICIRRCGEMSGIIQPPIRYAPTTVSLPYLREIVLFELRCLESICHGLVLNCPRLRALEAWSCENLRLPMIRLPEHNKIEIKGEEPWLSNLKWDNSDPHFHGNPDPESIFRLTIAHVRPELSSTPRMPRREGSISRSKSEAQMSSNAEGSRWFLKWLSLLEPLKMEIGT